MAAAMESAMYGIANRRPKARLFEREFCFGVILNSHSDLVTQSSIANRNPNSTHGHFTSGKRIASQENGLKLEGRPKRLLRVQKRIAIDEMYVALKNATKLGN